MEFENLFDLQCVRGSIAATADPSPTEFRTTTEHDRRFRSTCIVLKWLILDRLDYR
jgi:hypothetical protein